MATFIQKASRQFANQENFNPNVVRETPVCQRRPLRKGLDFSGMALSPTKRRKQSHVEESLVPTSLKLAGFKDEVRGPGPAETEQVGRFDLLLEVFSRLDAKDIVSTVAPVSKLWREVAHSKDLWILARRHMRLIDQFVVMEKMVERRSKGRMWKCRRLGTGEVSLLRMVDLELTNAGRDDGMPTSFLREAALLSELKHPNIIRHFGAEILAKKAVMSTEYVHESWSSWFKRLEVCSQFERVLDVRQKFKQMLMGLSYVHHQGLIHRNLKPDNLFLDLSGTVKIGDFTTTRTLDIPFQVYTPEDPKERDRSGREMRRLWYRAPELILRDEIYGPKVDMWSVGCLLVEAASGKSLFQSDGEIDHLFRVFRVVGTPTVETWPEFVCTKHYSAKFPHYEGFDLSQVARGACRTSLTTYADQDSLLRQAGPDRNEILEQLIATAKTLGVEGMFLVDQLVALPPSKRAGCEAALEASFFGPRPLQERRPSHAVEHWLTGRHHQRPFESPEPRRTPRLDLDDTPPAVRPGLPDELSRASCPPLSIPSSLIASEMVWNILSMMVEQERSGCLAHRGDLLIDPSQRATLVDFMVGLSAHISLRDNTVHLAVAVLDNYFTLPDKPSDLAELKVVAATCLKVCDVFAEQSKEYYKQENSVEYCEAAQGQNIQPSQILTCEKEFLPKVDFKLQKPTVHWFLQCYLVYARFNAKDLVGRTSSFIADLMLLDFDLIDFMPSLKAQCALLLAVFLVQELKQRQQEAAKDGKTSSSDRQPGKPRVGAGLPSLCHWDSHIREAACASNVAVDAWMCLQAVVRALVDKRREWKNLKLNAVETKHDKLARTLAYPERFRFPTSQLVRYILPNTQRGLIPE